MNQFFGLQMAPSDIFLPISNHLDLCDLVKLSKTCKHLKDIADKIIEMRPYDVFRKHVEYQTSYGKYFWKERSAKVNFFTNGDMDMMALAGKVAMTVGTFVFSVWNYQQEQVFTSKIPDNLPKFFVSDGDGGGSFCVSDPASLMANAHAVMMLASGIAAVGSAASNFQEFYQMFLDNRNIHLIQGVLSPEYHEWFNKKMRDGFKVPVVDTHGHVFNYGAIYRHFVRTDQTKVKIKCPYDRRDPHFLSLRDLRLDKKAFTAANYT